MVTNLEELRAASSAASAAAKAAYINTYTAYIRQRITQMAKLEELKAAWLADDAAHLAELKAAADAACIAHNVAVDARWAAVKTHHVPSWTLKAIAAADATLVTYTVAYEAYQAELDTGELK